MANVVILMSDEHNPYYSFVYGHPFVQTPNMDRLAAMGTIYDNAYCNSPLCLPSRSSFMSGLPVHRLQTYNNCNVFEADFPSYGGILREQGVHTVYAGNADSDTRGFAEVLCPGTRKQPGDVHFRRQPLAIRAGAHKRAKGYGVKAGAFDKPTGIVDRCIGWLREMAPKLEQPWTLTVNIGPPHFPHYVTQELWDLYPDGGDLPKYGSGSEPGRHPYAMDLRAHFETDRFAEEDIRGLRRGYLGCVTYVDRQLGRLLDTLEETGQLEHTVFVYTSDHGEMLGKFGLWWKCSMYEDSVRVPMIAAGPGFDRGRRVKTPVSLLDLQAAVFRAVDRPRPADWSGEPLQQIPAEDPGRAVFGEYHGHGVRSSSYMLRKGKWKLVYNSMAPHQLFDLEADPDELTNVYEAEAGMVEEMDKELRRFCSPEEETERALAHEGKQLEALGKC